MKTQLSRRCGLCGGGLRGKGNRQADAHAKCLRRFEKTAPEKMGLKSRIRIREGLIK